MDALELTARDYRDRFKTNSTIIVTIPSGEAAEMCREFGSVPAIERVLSARLGNPVQVNTPDFYWSVDKLHEITERLNRRFAGVR